jgi:ankyrin repeat protein
MRSNLTRVTGALPLAVLVALAVLHAAIASAATGSAAELIDAVRSGAIERLRTLIRPGTDVNAPQGDGATALHWAAHKNDGAAADLLIKAGGDANAANDLGATPIWLASLNGSAPMIARLLDAGAKPNVALPSGETPLMAAARAGHVQAVETLLARGADVNAREGQKGQTALMWAVEQRHAEVARTLLVHGADVHARSRVWQQLENTAGNANPTGDFLMPHGGSTALLIAARQGDVATTRVLLDGGANINDAAAVGTSALVVAAHSNHGPLARFLLTRGADPNAAGAGYTALQAAVLRGNADLVTALLAKGADPNMPVTHGTPVRRLSADFSIRHQMIGTNAFWMAARFGEVAIMRALAERGASARMTPKDGTTALKAAMGFVRGVTENRQGRYGVPPADHAEEERTTLEAARLIVAMGVDVNAVDAAGDTALHDAVRQRFVSVIQFLADHGASLNVINKRKQTPLMIALNEVPDLPPGTEIPNRQSTIDLLKTLGAAE